MQHRQLGAVRTRELIAICRKTNKPRHLKYLDMVSARAHLSLRAAALALLAGTAVGACRVLRHALLLACGHGAAAAPLCCHSRRFIPKRFCVT